MFYCGVVWCVVCVLRCGCVGAEMLGWCVVFGVGLVLVCCVVIRL